MHVTMTLCDAVAAAASNECYFRWNASQFTKYRKPNWPTGSCSGTDWTSRRNHDDSFQHALQLCCRVTEGNGKKRQKIVVIVTLKWMSLHLHVDRSCFISVFKHLVQRVVKFICIYFGFRILVRGLFVAFFLFIFHFSGTKRTLEFVTESRLCQYVRPHCHRQCRCFIPLCHQRGMAKCSTKCK